jgi:glycerol-3-phosphate acyltransferase PlsY
MEIPGPLRDLVIIAAAYLIGAIPWGVIMARVTGGPDPRTFGSGRTGGANVMRALGPRAALASGLLDMAKGTVAVLLARWLGAGPWIEVFAALAAVVGHTYSPFLGFKGGRGVATAFGALLVIGPLAALVAVPVFIGLVLLTGYSSVGSLVGALVSGVVLAATTLATDGPPAYLFYAVAGATLIWIFHKDNIERLRDGTERKLEFRRHEATAPPESGSTPSGSPPGASRQGRSPQVGGPPDGGPEGHPSG